MEQRPNLLGNLNLAEEPIGDTCELRIKGSQEFILKLLGKA